MLIKLPTDGTFSCSFTDKAAAVIPVHLTLSEAPTIPPAIKTVADVALGVSALSVVPSGMVRAGMITTVIQMLKCSAFDPEEEVGFVNNPFSWAAGREELRYHRGSVLTALIAMCIMLTCILGVLVVVRICGESITWGIAIDALRLPSLPLVAILLISEVAVSSAISMLLFQDSDIVDRVLALIVLSPLFAYISLYVYQTMLCGRYITVEAVVMESDDAKMLKVRTSGPGRMLRYLLEPTHQIVLVPDDDDGGEGGYEQGDGEWWLERNYYFVADRRWSPYGAIEVIGGTLTNMLEGIPLTTASRALCIARPVCVMLITAVLLVLLVWKVPNAIRLQQWCSIGVVSGMLLTSGLASVNAVTPSEGVELAAGYVGVAAVGVSMILGFVDTVVLIIVYIPFLRTVLSLRPRGVQTVIKQSRTETASRRSKAAPLLKIIGGDTPQAQGHDASHQSSLVSSPHKMQVLVGSKGWEKQVHPPPLPTLSDTTNACSTTTRVAAASPTQCSTVSDSTPSHNAVSSLIRVITTAAAAAISSQGESVNNRTKQFAVNYGLAAANDDDDLRRIADTTEDPLANDIDNDSLLADDDVEEDLLPNEPRQSHGIVEDDDDDLLDVEYDDGGGGFEDYFDAGFEEMLPLNEEDAFEL